MGTSISTQMQSLVTLADYAQEKGLTKYSRWRWTWKYTQKHEKFIRMVRIFKTQAKKFGKVYKFGVRGPRKVKEALELDKENGNTLWTEAMAPWMFFVFQHLFSPLL